MFYMAGCQYFCRVESSADWRSSSRDYQVAAAGGRRQDEDEEDDDGDDEGEELLRRVLIAGGLRPSSGAGGRRQTADELMEEREYVTSAGHSELSITSLRDKVRILLRR